MTFCLYRHPKIHIRDFLAREVPNKYLNMGAETPAGPSDVEERGLWSSLHVS